MQERGTINVHLILTLFLGFGMLLFGVLAIATYSDNTNIHRNLTALGNQAATKAAAKQKASDDIANTRANESPYRTYTASATDGSFQIQIPKNWSLYVGHNLSSTTPLDIAADPDFVTYNLGSGLNTLNSHAFHMQLVNESVQTAVKAYDAQIKKQLVTSKGVTVSGISGTWLEGAIDTQRHNGIVVILPTRSQTMLIWTDTHDYVSEFNTILNNAKIYP